MSGLGKSRSQNPDLGGSTAFGTCPNYTGWNIFLISELSHVEHWFMFQHNLNQLLATRLNVCVQRRNSTKLRPMETNLIKSEI